MQFEEGQKIKLKSALNWFISLLYLYDIDDSKINSHVTNLKTAVNDYFDKLPKRKNSEIKNIFIDEFLKEIKIHDFMDKVEETFLNEDHLRKLKLLTMVNIMYVIFWPDKCYIWVSGRKEAEIVQKYLQEKVNIKSTIESKPGTSYYPHPLVVTFDPKYRKTLVQHIEDVDYV